MILKIRLARFLDKVKSDETGEVEYNGVIGVI